MRLALLPDRIVLVLPDRGRRFTDEVQTHIGQAVRVAFDGYRVMVIPEDTEFIDLRVPTYPTTPITRYPPTSTSTTAPDAKVTVQ